MNWGNELPSSLTSENSSPCITIGEDGSSSPVYNKSDLSDSYFSHSYITISKNPKSNFTEFHNQGVFSFSGGRDFVFDMPDVDYYLDGGLFNIQYGKITLNGRDFYSQGEFIVNHKLDLNFRDFINVSNTKITGQKGPTINLTGKFSNDSKFNIKGLDKYHKLYEAKIYGGDFYNGIDHSSGQENFSGSIELEFANLDIGENLISEGTSENHSKIILSGDSRLDVKKDFTNGPYSDLYINPSNEGWDYSILNVYGNMINQGEIHLAMNTESFPNYEIYVKKNFISKEGSKLYFTGGYGYYGKIQAQDIDIRGASVYFSKGQTFLDHPYNFLAAYGTFKYDASLLGVQDVISDDGSVNDFYEAVVETGLDDEGVRALKVIYRYKTKKPKEEVNISENTDTTTSVETSKSPKEEVNISSNTDTTTSNPQKEVNISENSDTTTITKIPSIRDKYTPSEILIVYIFSKENPIPGFDIKTLGANQIKTISKNISDGLQSYTHSKDAALSTGFEAIKTNLFARMIGGGNSPSFSHRSAILPYSSSVHYAANTAKSNYPATKASDYTQSDVIAYPPTTNSKDNNLYVNLLGALQTSPGGYGYNYGLSIGYDRNFDDKLFVGVYLAYIGGSLSFDTLSTQTQGFEAGVYARFKTSIFETDMILNQGYAYNKTHKNITILTDTYSTYSHYGTQSYDLLLQSGPRFDFGKNTIKPYIGLNINLNTGGDIDEDAQALASSYHFKDNLYLSESIGIEYKRLFKQGYFFIRPSYEANIWSNASETQVLFLNNTISIAIPPKEMFGSVLLGGEVAINNSLLLNLNASAKASNQKTFIATGMASLKYVF